MLISASHDLFIVWSFIFANSYFGLFDVNLYLVAIVPSIDFMLKMSK